MDVRGLASHDGRPILDSNHIGPVVLIFIPTFLCPAGLLVLSSIIVRKRAGADFSWRWSNPVMWDFAGLVCMLTITVAWSAVVCSHVQIGLGTSEPPVRALLFEKFEYAAELLYLLAITTWKCSNGLCNTYISSISSDRRGLYSLILTLASTLAFLGAFFASAFQCDGPRFWAIRHIGVSHCFNRPAFWASVGAIDILSDIAIHGVLIVTIFKSQMALQQKRSACTIVCIYLASYIATASVRLAFVTQSWGTSRYALLAARASLSTFSQLIFPITVLCIGKVAKFLDLESYLSPAIGVSSRKKGQHPGRDYLRQYDGQTSSSATGPRSAARTQKRTSGNSEALPLRTYSNDEGPSREGDAELSDAILVKKDITVQRESGHLDST